MPRTESLTRSTFWFTTAIWKPSQTGTAFPLAYCGIGGQRGSETITYHSQPAATVTSDAGAHRGPQRTPQTNPPAPRSASSILGPSSPTARSSSSSWFGAANWTSCSRVLRGNIGSASVQHVLVVAPRGRGKTMLLARAEAELRTNEELSEHFLPVRFMEENHEISTVADFWIETLFHLARVSAPAHPGLATELRATHASLCDRWRERTLHEHARAAVLDAADRLGRKLVLMVENLQALSNNVDDDFGWQLRAVLQSEPQIMLLGSAVSRFQALDDAEQPFFELFRIVELKPLDTDECHRLWRAVSGDSARGREIRPVEILTGGSPRLLVIVAGFAKHRSLRRLMEELVTLIDDHTEYFRGHLEVLPKSERRVYAALIDLWRPSSTGEIAARARMDVRIISTMLGRLVDRGAVTPEPGRKRRQAALRSGRASLQHLLQAAPRAG